MNYKFKAFWIRLFNWEYWPTSLVYGPIFPVYLWYCLRARSFFFFSTSNLTIKNAGLLMESKFEIDSIVPEMYRPRSLYFEPSAKIDEIREKLASNQFVYPMIVKPDIGGKGVGVKKIHSAQELGETILSYPVPFIIQPFIDLPNEIGLFYVKMPGEEKGTITGIVRKEFLKLTGNGINTILELLQKNDRYLLQIPALKKALLKDIDRVIAKDVTEILVPYGNHARGSLFLDDSELISPELIDSFNKICGQIDGFNFGRMDVRFNTWEELTRGINFSIIELNGAGSEPTNIYDPRHSIFFAWKEIIRHWRLLWEVSLKNKRKNNIGFMTFREGLQMLIDNDRYNKKCKAAFQ